MQAGVAEFDWSHLESLETQIDGLTPRQVPREFAQRLLQVGVRLYFNKREGGEDFGPFHNEEAVSATEGMVASANILEAIDVDVFELGLWKSLTGS